MRPASQRRPCKRFCAPKVSAGSIVATAPPQLTPYAFFAVHTLELQYAVLLHCALLLHDDGQLLEEPEHL